MFFTRNIELACCTARSTLKLYNANFIRQSSHSRVRSNASLPPFTAVAGSHASFLSQTTERALMATMHRIRRNAFGPEGVSSDLPIPRPEVQNRVMEALKKFDKIDASKLSADTNLLKDLGLDSLDHVELIMAIEDEFGVEISEADGEKLITPKDIVAHVVKLAQAPELERKG